MLSAGYDFKQEPINKTKQKTIFVQNDDTIEYHTTGVEYFYFIFNFLYI